MFHRNTFENILAANGIRPTILTPLWHVAGFSLGAITALMGKESAMLCTEAVETAVGEHYQDQITKLEQMEQEQARRYNSLSARINRGWHTVRYLIKVRYRPEGFSDLEFLAHCLLKQHLDHYQVPLWLAPTRLTRLQRKMMINEADWAAEGGLKKAELSKMSDQDLAVAYLGALRDYCVSQGLT